MRSNVLISTFKKKKKKIGVTPRWIVKIFNKHVYYAIYVLATIHDTFTFLIYNIHSQSNSVIKEKCGQSEIFQDPSLYTAHKEKCIIDLIFLAFSTSPLFLFTLLQFYKETYRWTTEQNLTKDRTMKSHVLCNSLFFSSKLRLSFNIAIGQLLFDLQIGIVKWKIDLINGEIKSTNEISNHSR